MKYLIDTNVVIGLSKGIPALTGRLRRATPSDIGLSVIVLHELYFGAHKGRRVVSNLNSIADLNFNVVDFDKDDARHAGEIRALLAMSGRPIGPLDILIAGQALARGLTLITRNVREFSRVPNLPVEDWEA